jgi:2'-5' RNA ligase
MAEKTYKTAVVWIPPQEAWEPIQAIRRQHDRQVRRWMPHVTLIYPFRAPEELDALAPLLAEACRGVEPFDLELREFRFFSHGRGSFTMWLSPEPAEALARLQEALQAAVPDCDDVRRHPKGFTPHLSVGQVRDRRALRGLLADLQAAWRALRCRAEAVSMIRRGDPPDDCFRVDRTILLGVKAAGTKEKAI